MGRAAEGEGGVPCTMQRLGPFPFLRYEENLKLAQGRWAPTWSESTGFFEQTLYWALWTTMLYGHLLARLVTTMVSSLAALRSWPTEEEERRPVHKPWIAAQKNLRRQVQPYVSNRGAYLLTYPFIMHSFPVSCYQLPYFIFFIILNTSEVNLFFYCLVVRSFLLSKMSPLQKFLLSRNFSDLFSIISPEECLTYSGCSENRY